MQSEIFCKVGGGEVFEMTVPTYFIYGGSHGKKHPSLMNQAVHHWLCLNDVWVNVLGSLEYEVSLFYDEACSHTLAEGLVRVIISPEFDCETSTKKNKE